MSWKLGKSKSKQSPASSSLSIQEMDTSRSTTPTPRNPDGSRPQFRSGILAIHVNRAEGLELPTGCPIPPAVQTALTSTQAQAASSVSPSSVAKQRSVKQRGHKDSVQRVGCWWLPYLVMEFEVNQIVLTPLGGDIKQPVYMYQATLYVFFHHPLMQPNADAYVIYSSDVSRNSEISLQCYLRTEEPKRGGDGIADDMGNDIYMGGVRFTPDFDDMGAPQEQWYELSGGSGDGEGKVMIALAYQPSTVSFCSMWSYALFSILFCRWILEVLIRRLREPRCRLPVIVLPSAEHSMV